MADNKKKFLDEAGVTKISRLVKDMIEEHTEDDGIHVTSTDKANLSAAVAHAKQTHAPATAEKNVIVTVKKNGTALTPDSSRAVNVTVPTKVSELTNDSSYATTSSVSSSISSSVSSHNTNTSAHSDIRSLITTINTRLNAALDSDDTTLDQMSEIVAYIKSNKSLIDSVTISKVNTSDIVDNLTTNVTTKVLAASQGVAIKKLIDALQIAVDSKAVSGHTHDDRYYTESEMNTKLSGYSTTSHTHDLSTMINTLSIGDSTPTDADYYVSQYVGGGTTTTTYHRRPMSALFNYIKSKLASVAVSGSYNDLSNKPTIGNGTITVTQNGTSKGTFTMNQTGATTIALTDTNTWRGIQDNLTSTSTSDSLSANQGRLLANGSARDNTKLPLAGGTMTGRIVRSSGGSWIADRDNVAVFNTRAVSNSWSPVVGQKTVSGAWTIGNIGGSESLIFNYSTDTNYNAGTNSSINVYLPPYAGTIITTATIGSQSVNYATSASKLSTARTINGASFDGSANITTTNWGTTRTLTIGSTGKSVNGSGNVSWSLSEIGAAAASHTHNYAGSSSAGGDATNALKLSGYSASSSATANTIALRNSSGYLFATYLNQSSNTETPTTSSYIMYANSDGYLRKSTLANVKTILGLGSAAYTASTAYATAGHTHNIINAQGRLEPQTDRNATSGLWTYGYYNATNGPSAYGEVVSFGHGTNGHAEIAISWSGTPSMYMRSLRDYQDSWTGWVKLLDANNYTSYCATASHTHSNYASTVTTTGSGNAVTAVSQSGNTITVTKGTSFLPLSGGTMTGSLNSTYSGLNTITGSGSVSIGVMAKNSEGSSVSLMIGSGKVNHGLYSQTLDKWMVYANATNVYLNGNASTSTIATTLARSGNNSYPMTFNWSGQSGQPNWLWGGSDGTNMYVYNPSNFYVHYSTNTDAVKMYGNDDNGGVYHLMFGTGSTTGTYYNVHANSALQYHNYVGTTSQIGGGYLIIGNDIASGTAGNKFGDLRLYSTSSGYSDLRCEATTGAAVNYLPAQGGILLNTTNIPAYARNAFSRGMIPDYTDLNTVTESGFYTLAADHYVHSAVSYGTLIVFDTGYAYTAQMIITFSGYFYWRFKSETGSWTSWFYAAGTAKS